MLFILRAIFWIAAVAAFMPAGFHMTESRLTDDLRHWVSGFAAEQSAVSRSGSDITFCNEHAEACQVGQELGVLVDVIGAVASERVERIIEDSEAR
ncbi:MAG: hypothetical protein AAFX09_00015 [Pseudomonadota bacterium]